MSNSDHSEPKQEARRDGRDFSSQLGIHIACYYWNGSFPNEVVGENALDRFFSVADQHARSVVIGQIASIWEKPSKEKPDSEAIARVMRIWERRHAQIQKALNNDTTLIAEFENEIAESIDLLNCECFPFDWRFDQAKKSLERLRKVPRAYQLLKAICEFGIIPERIEFMLNLLNILLQKPGGELRWSIQFKNMAPVISLGLKSKVPSTHRLAEKCRDSLLKMGFSEFLNLNAIE